MSGEAPRCGHDGMAGDEPPPEGWAKASLSEGLIADIQPGFACGQNNRVGEGVAHLRPMNVNETGRIDLSDMKYVPYSQADRDERLLREGDVVFNNTNSPELVGKTAHYDLPEPRAFSNHMTRLRCRLDALHPRYCAMLLHQMWREGYFGTVCNNHVSQSSVSRAVLLNTPILLPPLAEQKRIVAKAEELLTHLDAARERLNRVPAILERLRQAVVAGAFCGRLTADWRDEHPDVEPASVLLEELTTKSSEPALRSVQNQGDDGDAGEIPDTWAWTTVGACFDVKIGATPRRQEPGFWNGDIPWVSSGEVQFCRIKATRERITAAGLESSSTQLNPAGSVLLGMIGEGRTRGQSAILDIEACNNQNCAAIWVSQTPVPPEFVYYWLMCRYQETRGRGAGNEQPALNKARVQRIPLPFPPLAEQHEIVRRVEALFKLADAIERRVATATVQADKLTQSILAKAFRGELVPTEAELARREGRDYEPASALLERIQGERQVAAGGRRKRR